MSRAVPAAAGWRYKKSNKVDMTQRKWGALTALSPGYGSYWFFKCDQGHEVLVDANRVRRAIVLREQGKGFNEGGAPASPVGCPECKRLKNADR